MFRVDPHHFTVAQVHVINVTGEITCLAVGADDTIWAGIQDGQRILLGRSRLQDHFAGLSVFDLTDRKPLSCLFLHHSILSTC